MHRRRSARGLLVIALVYLIASVTAVGADDLDPSAITWSSLALRARRLGVTFRSTVTIEVVKAREASSQLFSRPEGQELVPRGADLVLTTLGTRGLGRQSEIRLWTEPEDGVALQRDQLDRGRRDRFRVNRYERTGVFALRHSPAAGEESRPHAQWTEVNESMKPYPEWTGEGMEVSDPTAMFYFLAVAKLDQVGDSAQFPVFSRDKLLLVDVKVVGRERARVDFQQKSGGRSERVRGNQELVKLVIDGSHLGPTSVEDDFEFMGLRGDVEILLHPALRVPVEVSGRVPRAGTVRLRLQEVEVK